MKKKRARTTKPKPAEGNIDQPERTEEQEKLQEIKDTVEGAIILVQKKLGSLSEQLEKTDKLEVAIEIGRRVRTAKRVLFPPGEEPKARLPHSSGKQPCGFTLSSGSAERQGKRKTMEDASVLIDNLAEEFPNLKATQTWAFYAVYDGHGGSATSTICSQYLHKNLITCQEFNENNFSAAFTKAYDVTDKYALQESETHGFKDGSTAVTVLINNNTLVVANAGDSEAVLCVIE